MMFRFQSKIEPRASAIMTNAIKYWNRLLRIVSVIHHPGCFSFRKSIKIFSYSKHVEDSTMYISPENVRLTNKDA